MEFLSQVLPGVPQELVALAAIAFLGAVMFGITGFGSALITIPLSSFFVPLPFALALFALLDLTNAIRIGMEDPRSAVRSEWTRMVPAILVGTVAGITLLVHLPRRATLAALAVFILAMGVSTFVRGGALRTVRAGWAYVAGVAGGVTSTLFGAGGPPYAIYLSRRGLSKEQYRSTLGRCTMISIGSRVVAFLLTGLLLDPKVWIAAVAAFPTSWLGLNVAARLFRHMSRDMLLRVVAVGLIVTGISLAVRAIRMGS